jgi:uncharacterized protein
VSTVHETDEALFTGLGFELNQQFPEYENSVAIVIGVKLHAEPEDHGFMYHWSFVDLDGHLWTIHYMNKDAAQGG